MNSFHFGRMIAVDAMQFMHPAPRFVEHEILKWTVIFTPFWTKCTTTWISSCKSHPMVSTIVRIKRYKRTEIGRHNQKRHQTKKIPHSRVRHEKFAISRLSAHRNEENCNFPFQKSISYHIHHCGSASFQMSFSVVRHHFQMNFFSMKMEALVALKTVGGMRASNIIGRIMENVQWKR